MHVLVFYPLLNWKMHGETMKMRQEYLWCKLSDFQHSLLRQLLFPMCECWSETWHFLKRIGLYTIKPWYYITVIMSRSWLLLVFRRVLWKIRLFITYIRYFSIFVGTMECESWLCYGDVTKRKECSLIRTHKWKVSVLAVSYAVVWRITLLKYL